jgi:hypothetical protein
LKPQRRCFQINDIRFVLPDDAEKLVKQSPFNVPSPLLRQIVLKEHGDIHIAELVGFATRR